MWKYKIIMIGLLFIVLHLLSEFNGPGSNVEDLENIEKGRDYRRNLATLEPDWV
jgi:hypothetical protein